MDAGVSLEQSDLQGKELTLEGRGAPVEVSQAGCVPVAQGGCHWLRHSAFRLTTPA